MGRERGKKTKRRVITSWKSASVTTEVGPVKGVESDEMNLG